MEKQMNASRLILVAIDETEKSENALQWALNKLFTSQDRIVLVHAQPDPNSASRNPGILFSPAVNNSENIIEKSTEKILAKAMAVCKAKNVFPQRKVYTGHARKVLCNAAEEYNPDMLVIGSNGYGALKRLFLGSVSDHCVHHVQCPVVVVKSRKKKAR